LSTKTLPSGAINVLSDMWKT